MWKIIFPTILLCGWILPVRLNLTFPSLHAIKCSLVKDYWLNFLLFIMDMLGLLLCCQAWHCIKKKNPLPKSKSCILSGSSNILRARIIINDTISETESWYCFIFYLLIYRGILLRIEKSSKSPWILLLSKLPSLVLRK